MNRTPAQIGELVAARRKHLRLKVREAAARGAISHTTWYEVEKGNQTSDDTRLGVCRALDWTDDTWGRLLAGEDPVEQDRTADRSTRPSYEAELLSAIRDLQSTVDRLAERLPPPAPPADEPTA